MVRYLFGCSLARSHIRRMVRYLFGCSLARSRIRQMVRYLFGCSLARSRIRQMVRLPIRVFARSFVSVDVVASLLRSMPRQESWPPPVTPTTFSVKS